MSNNDSMKNGLFRINRRSLLLGLTGVVGGFGIWRLRQVEELAMLFNKTDESSDVKMPVLFLGHGNPMNAIADNSFTRRLAEMGKEFPKPKAILCVSAHWLSAGTWVTHMEKPKTIHDFYGFPQQLFDVQYPAPGSPQVAELIQSLSTSPRIQADDKSWGLDHGTWSVLCKMYPQADIPVLQLSIDMSEPASFHFKLGQTLKALRDQGVLIVGSGNIVHNLRRVEWEMTGKGTDWAIEFDEWIKGRLEARDFRSLTEEFLKTKAGQLSVPTPDHYLPMLYVLGAADEKENLKFEFEGYDMGSISMRCFSFGRQS